MADHEDLDTPEALLTPSEVAAMFRVNPKTVTRWARAGKLNAIRTLGASRRQTVTTVLLPATLPDILSGLRVAVGFAWTTVVAAELVNGLPGIGGLAYLSGTQNKIALSVACILVIGITAIALDALIRSIEKALVPWRGKD